MRYVLLISHGTFAPGLHSVLNMLVGKRDDIISCSMEDGIDADIFVARLKKLIAPIDANDEVIVLADIIGGSPLTNTINVLSSRGLLPKTKAFGGMNLAMALTAAMGTDEDLPTLCEGILAEGKAAVREMSLSFDEDDEDI